MISYLTSSFRWSLHPLPVLVSLLQALPLSQHSNEPKRSHCVSLVNSENPTFHFHFVILLRERIRVAISLISRPQRKTAPHSPLVARGPPIRPSTAGERTRFRRSRACAPTTHDATDRCASDSRLRCATALPPRSVIVNFVT